MGAINTVIDNTFLKSEGYFSIAVVLACFVIGYVIKHYTSIANNYIPLIMIGIGVIINTLLNIPAATAEEDGSGITVVTVLIGAVSGLASSGLYEMLAKSLGLKNEEKEKEDKDDDD